MEINVLIEEDFEGCLDAGWLRGVAETALAAEQAGADSEMGIVITGQESIRDLNAVHLGEDRPTDVLSFPMTPGPEEAAPAFVEPPDGVRHLGEVIISYPQAVIQAEENGHPVAKEVAILLVHGVLHLLGYDHDAPEPEERMKAGEARILGTIEEAAW